MYAVVRTGGKQVRVQPGDLVDLDLLDGEPGQRIELAEVLMIGVTAHVRQSRWWRSANRRDHQAIPGQAPHLQVQAPQAHRLTKGHRQHFTRVKIDSIEV
jgi:large subunit ribosomal protein L21